MAYNDGRRSLACRQEQDGYHQTPPGSQESQNVVSSKRTQHFGVHHAGLRVDPASEVAGVHPRRGQLAGGNTASLLFLELAF